MFIYIDKDPSTKSRTTSYEMVLQFFHQSPFIGRGLAHSYQVTAYLTIKFY